MGIYYMDAGVIGRSSGRSAVGAAAYRRSEKMKSVAHAAYQRGEKIHQVGDEVVHDYRAKGGVVHSEIRLPENVPREFYDSETLWNAVEAREKRADARLAREIVVALPCEFDLREQVEVLREYSQENFVNKGLGADFSVHDKGDGNPHAHIMFTTRYVTPEGLGRKNRDLDKKSELMIWRKSWADVNNRMFERKGLAERIDHRSYKDQGIDREPMVHMGHKATALERKGVKTDRGDYNREIQRRNAEREARKTAERKESQDVDEDSHATADKEPDGLKERKALTEAKRVLWEIEQHRRTENAERIVQEMAERREIAETMNESKENYVALEKELNALKFGRNKEEAELPRLIFRAEDIDEQVKNIERLQRQTAELQEIRQNLGFWDFEQKKEKDREIAQAEQKLRTAQEFFLNRFHVDPSQAQDELKRVQKEIRDREASKAAKTARIEEIIKQQADIELAYHTQKLLNEIRPDRQQIANLVEKLSNPPKNVRDRQLYDRITHQLNTIAEEKFQKIIDNLPENQANPLIKEKERAKAKEQNESRDNPRPPDRNR
jgi:hypothetical protein